MSERQPLMEVEGTTNPDWTNPLNHTFAGRGGGANKIRKNKSKCDELIDLLRPEYQALKGLERIDSKTSCQHMFVKLRIYDYFKGQGGEFYVILNGVRQICPEDLALKKIKEKIRKEPNDESCVGGKRKEPRSESHGTRTRNEKRKEPHVATAVGTNNGKPAIRRSLKCPPSVSMARELEMDAKKRRTEKVKEGSGGSFSGQTLSEQPEEADRRTPSHISEQPEEVEPKEQEVEVDLTNPLHYVFGPGGHINKYHRKTVCHRLTIDVEKDYPAELGREKGDDSKQKKFVKDNIYDPIKKKGGVFVKIVDGKYKVCSEAEVLKMLMNKIRDIKKARTAKAKKSEKSMKVIRKPRPPSESLKRREGSSGS